MREPPSTSTCPAAPPAIAIFGAAGYGRALRYVLQHAFARPLCRVVAFVDDEEGGRGTMLDDTPVLSVAQWSASHLSLPVVVSVGKPRARRVIVERLAGAGACFPAVFADTADLFPGVSFAPGSFVGSHTYIGPLTSLGAHAQIMAACSIGHDVAIGAFATICPSCTVSGYVEIEEGVFLGAGTTIVNGRPGAPIRIGRGAQVAAGSVVTKSVPPGDKFAGNPARPMRALAAERAAARPSAARGPENEPCARR